MAALTLLIQLVAWAMLGMEQEANSFARPLLLVRIVFGYIGLRLGWFVRPAAILLIRFALLAPGPSPWNDLSITFLLVLAWLTSPGPYGSLKARGRQDYRRWVSVDRDKPRANVGTIERNLSGSIDEIKRSLQSLICLVCLLYFFTRQFICQTKYFQLGNSVRMRSSIFSNFESHSQGGHPLNYSRLLPMIGFIFLLPAIWAGGDPAKGKAGYAVCTACHGANGEGNPLLHSPALAGQESWYLMAQIKNFQEGLRGTVAGDTWGSTMIPMAKILQGDQAIADVVAYIRSMKEINSKPTLKGGDVEKGKAAYIVCTACHGANAEGNEALHSPRLNIQPDWYMLEQLQKFKNGMRGAHPKDIWGSTMAPMAKILADDQAMKDVIAYIKSLK